MELAPAIKVVLLVKEKFLIDCYGLTVVHIQLEKAWLLVIQNTFWVVCLYFRRCLKATDNSREYPSRISLKRTKYMTAMFQHMLSGTALLCITRV